MQAGNRRSVMSAVTFVFMAALLLTGCLGFPPPVGDVDLRQTPSEALIWDSSDPDVLVDAGTTYLYGSTNNKKLPVRVSTSTTQTLSQSKSQWDNGALDAMPTRPAWVDSQEWEIWAPAVVKIGSLYWVYFAGHRTGASDEANDQCIGRASASGPLGPFAPESSPIYCGMAKRDAEANWWGHGALDPEIVRTPDDSLHLLVALSRTHQNIGSVPLASDGTVPGGINAAPSILASQGLPYHDGTDDSTLGPAFLENPSMVYEPASRSYLLFYSAGHWSTANYVTGFARCSTPTGPCSLDTRGPFLQSGATRTGPGGLSVFNAADGSLRVTYSSWQTGREAPSYNPGGQYSRQGHWGRLEIIGSDPVSQSVRLR